MFDENGVSVVGGKFFSGQCKRRRYRIRPQHTPTLLDETMRRSPVELDYGPVQPVSPFNVTSISTRCPAEEQWVNLTKVRVFVVGRLRTAKPSRMGR